MCLLPNWKVPPDLSRGGLTFKKAKTEKERTEQAKLDGF
jgi:hypothetical protein